MPSRLIQLLGLLCCLLAPVAHAAIPVLRVQSDAGLVNLTAWIQPQTQALALQPAFEPERFWQQMQKTDVGAPAPGLQGWLILPGHRSVAAFTVQAGAAGRFILEVPLVRIDQTAVFWRTPGQPWVRSQAGDTVAQNDWPFLGQFPAFPLDFGDQPIEMVITVLNSTRVQLPLWLMPDALYQERRLLQANLSGLMIGIGFTVLLVCAFTTLTQRRRDVAVLVAFSAIGWLTVLCVNGYAAVWLTPNWPLWNDASKHFMSVHMGALLLAVTAWTLDARHLIAWQLRLPGWVLAGVLCMALAQALLLPLSWRELSAYGWLALSVLASLLLCLQTRLLGADDWRWPTAGVLVFGLAVLCNLLPRGDWLGLDLPSALVAFLLACSALLFRQGVVLRYQHGRDVLGRDAQLRLRDPLTALLSNEGFRHHFDQHLLRQNATDKAGWLGLLDLRQLPQAMADYGLVLTEQLMVRVAAILQREMGGHWAISRIDDRRFALLAIDADARLSPAAQFAAVLAAALRYSDPPGWVDKLDLRFACVQRQFKSTELQALLQALGQVIEEIRDQRRIVVL